MYAGNVKKKEGEEEGGVRRITQEEKKKIRKNKKGWDAQGTHELIETKRICCFFVYLFIFAQGFRQESPFFCLGVPPKKRSFFSSVLPTVSQYLDSEKPSVVIDNHPPTLYPSHTPEGEFVFALFSDPKIPAPYSPYIRIRISYSDLNIARK